MKDSFIPLKERKYEPLGAKSSEIINRTEKHSAQNYAPYPFVVKRTEGPWIFDVDGNRALDFLSAYSAILYHKHPGVIEAVKHEMEHGSDLVSRALYTRSYADFVEAVANTTGYDKVNPKSDGGTATDAALKGLFMHAAKRGIEQPNVVLTKDYFHGRTMPFACSATFDPDQVAGMNIKFPGMKVVDDNLEAVTDAIDKNTIGIFIETHKGEGGPLFSTADYFLGVRKLAREKNIYFGVDEIQTGLGRCGYLMAWQEYGEEARPDFVTLGKALGGGIIPVSAVVGTKDFMDIYTPGTDGSTHGGYPLACVAACAALKYIKEEGIAERSRELGDHFVQQLEQIPGINVEHRGLLIRVEIDGIDTAKYACLEMLVGGGRDPRVFMKAGHSNLEQQVSYTRIAPPPGAMTKELIDHAFEKTIAPVLRDSTR